MTERPPLLLRLQYAAVAALGYLPVVWAVVR